MDTITLQDIKQQALEFQKKFYFKPTEVYISPDVAEDLAPCVHDWVHSTFQDISDIVQPPVRNGGRYSVHGLVMDGFKYHVLLTNQKNFMSFGLVGNERVSARAHYYIQTHISLEVSDVPPEA